MIEGGTVEQRQEHPVRDTPHKAAKPIDPRIKTLAHREQQHGLLRLRLSLHDLVIVVNLDVEESGAALAKPLLQIAKLRFILDIERHQRIHLRRHNAMVDMVGTPLMAKAVTALRPPDLIHLEIRPDVRHARPLLRLRAAEIFRKLTVAPLQVSVLRHNENRLREPIDRIVHHIVDITNDAHTVAFKTPFPVMTPFPRKCGEQRPQEKRGSAHIGIVAIRHEREREHDDQMDRQINPRG